MATRTAAAHPQPDWQRVTALSTTFLTHVAAAIALAIPLAMPLTRAVPARVEASLVSEPPPPQPIPEDPVPPPHPRVQHTAPPVRQPIPVQTQSAIQVPVEPVAVDVISVATTTTIAPVGDDAGPIGETRQLDYDGALKLRYPATALRQREQGRVLLNVLVDAGGNVQRIEIARSSGHANLDAAAREAVQRAHFKPVLRDGKAISAWGMVPIEFRLDRA
jgi:protein TonB